ncbi:hypothetical protein Llala01_00588 [Lactococcus lactis subsp. lactis]|uniref:Uncharacterized protein n=1 Tax=Lactococcus lactis subsp. lactis TaxID=1360 RepID=A0A0V8BK01_LACLL|nr:hypothetical protein ATCC19435_0273 [Lactococcus lactis subsp. lactis]KSU26577.1 hypothetical protein N42_1515 [Lactococcus lactis subsp. lactis]MDU0408586.1 hypothetical protein [Lactococcus lactis]TDG87132.1 hypothetical protein C5L15_000499 [Lactococcus lactis subsp. lactis]SCW35958.1 hypothetical protein SAMN02982984_00741 [Lactococcus lactis]
MKGEILIVNYHKREGNREKNTKTFSNQEEFDYATNFEDG